MSVLQKVVLFFLMWGIYGDLEKKTDSTMSSACMVGLSIMVFLW